MKKVKKENQIKNIENKLLKKQNKEKDEVIHDLDKYNYRGQCETLKLENENLKKKLKIYEEKLNLARISLGKDSSNSCKPSSTNGYNKVIQNNRVKSGKKPGREKCLKTRLKEYVDNHLRFLTDFKIDFTNNLAERGLRAIKMKLKIVGTFRDLKSAKWYCSAMNIIDTCKKNKIDIGNTIESIFMGKKKIFNFA